MGPIIPPTGEQQIVIALTMHQAEWLRLWLPILAEIRPRGMSPASAETASVIANMIEDIIVNEYGEEE